jgi:hypothetical protein
MFHTARWVAAVTLAALLPLAARADYAIKEAETPVPKEVNKAVADVLGKKSVQLIDEKGGVLCEVWMRKEVPTSATPQQLKAGVTYQEVPETTLLGVMQVAAPMTDYRKQKIKPGVYTLRLGFQPSDGDHMGTAPNKEFALVTPAADDKDPGPLGNAKDLQERSAKATGGSHPGVFLLFPGKDPGNAPKLSTMPGNHWVLFWKQDATAKDQKGTLVIGLTLIGTSTAA